MHRTALIASLLLTSGLLFAAAEDPVKTDAGSVSGVATATPDVRVYKGIPYAAPPVGDLRWKAPQPAAHWDAVKKADTFSATCTQGAGRGGNTGEDCLYLNVWTGATKAGEKRPVMVWIYGGGYTSGSGSQAMYDGEELAKKGAVIVTFNYRLGALGFFSYPELTTESDRRGAGNFGVMDSISALQWVQKNIAAFGGDPKNVTIFGESAGSGMVANLMAIPSTKGLFERAIGESSAWSTIQVAKLQTLAEAEEAGTKAAERMGAKSLAELRAKPAADIIRGGGRGAAPIVDGFLIREDPGKVFSEGKVQMPVLVGSNRDESFGNARTAADFIEQAHKTWGDMADAFLKIYPASSDEQAKESAFYSGRDQMAFVMRNWAHLASKNGKKSYVYYFTEQPPVVPGGRGGGTFAPGPHGSATHVSEILYVFNHLDNSRPWTDQDKQVADSMSSYWVNFAKTGDPNGKGMGKWAAWDEKTKQPMIFGNPPEGQQAPSDAAMAFFQSYFDKLYAK